MKAGLLLSLAALLLCSCRTPEQPQGQSKALAAIASPGNYLAAVSSVLTRAWPTNRTVTIVCHGHSVPAGYFKTPMVQTFDAYPHLLHVGLSQRFPRAVINVIVTAVGGENSEQGAKRFKRDVLSLRPDLVTVDYALNDRAIGLVRAQAAWRAMISLCVARGIPVILLTPTPDQTAHLDDPNDPLNLHAEQIRGLAAEYHVGLADSLSRFKRAMGEGVPLVDLMSQSNHPNRKGHELVVEELLKWFPQR